MHSTLKVCKVLKMNRERLRDWMVQGHIKPTQTVEEHGTKAGFTDSDVVGIALFKKLVDMGYKRELIGELLKDYIGVGGAFLNVASYLIFRIETNKKGKRNIISRIIGGGGGKLTIKLEHDNIMVDDIIEVKSTEWEDFHTINLHKIKGEVFRALEKNR